MELYLTKHDVLGYRAEAFMGKQRIARTKWYKTSKEAKEAIKGLIGKFSVKS